MAGGFAEAEIQMDLRPGKHNCSITDRAAASSAALFIYLLGLNTDAAQDFIGAHYCLHTSSGSLQ